jgi:small subunit ribosomal protein S3
MSHKVHPKSYRIREIADWSSRGFYGKNMTAGLKEDFIIRSLITKKLEKIGVEKIEIERFARRLNIIIYSSRPGLIIGRGGEGVEKLRKEVVKALNGKSVNIEIKEVRNPWTSASLSAQWAAQQIEKRLPYRRVLKQTIEKILLNKDIKGARIELSGRLGGVAIARKEWLQKGRMPRQTIRAIIDYSLAEARCPYGTIGVKVWIYKGEKF